MKRSLLVYLSSATAVALALAGCGGAPVGVATPTAAAMPVEPAVSPAAPAAPKAETTGPSTPARKGSLDPLSVGGDLEAASVPTIVKTPAKALRPKSRADLEAAMALLAKESTPEGALKRVTARLGEPTWTEDGKKSVWIAKAGKSCHRFVLESDGQADIETASTTEWRMLTALAKQSACTGEIKRGALGD